GDDVLPHDGRKRWVIGVYQPTRPLVPFELAVYGPAARIDFKQPRPYSPPTFVGICAKPDRSIGVEYDLLVVFWVITAAIVKDELSLWIAQQYPDRVAPRAQRYEPYQSADDCRSGKCNDRICDFQTDVLQYIYTFHGAALHEPLTPGFAAR